ncbi:MAG: YtxH domain-containing protein [Flavitalea sp.]
MTSTSKVIIATLAGVAAGVAIGLLVAPDKGSETRRRIAEGSTDLWDSMKDQFSGMVDTMKDEYDHAKSAVSDMANKAKGKVPSMNTEV